MKFKTIALFICVSVSLSSGLLALGIRIADQNPEATARGNAFAATADNPSAVYYNPAGITQLEGQQFLLGAYGISLETRYTSPTGESFSTKDKIQGVPQVFYTFTPHRYALSLGLGIYSPYGFGLEYPDDTPFRTLATRGSVKYLTINPVAAYKLTDTLSIALGATINLAQAELRRGIFQQGDEFKFRGDGVAYGFNAGVMWQPAKMHSFGLTYRSATNVEFGGHSTIKTKPFVVPTAGGPVTVPGAEFDQDADAEIHFPQSIVLGYSFRPTPEWNFEVNVDWTDWDALNTVTLNQQRTGAVALPFNWESSFFYEFGATRYFRNGMHASAGYIYSENSVPDESFNPLVPDSNRHIFSIGLGQKLERFSWDIAYQLAYGPSRTISNGSLADGSYRFTSHAISLSLGYNF